VRKCLKFNLVGRRARDLECVCANRLLRCDGLPDLVEVALAQDRPRRPILKPLEPPVGLREFDLDSLWVDGPDGLEVRQRIRPPADLLSSLDGKDHVVGCEVGTVVEGHTVAEVVDIGGWVRLFPGACETRFDGVRVEVEADEPLVNMVRHYVGCKPRPTVGVEFSNGVNHPACNRSALLEPDTWCSCGLGGSEQPAHGPETESESQGATHELAA